MYRLPPDISRCSNPCLLAPRPFSWSLLASPRGYFSFPGSWSHPLPPCPMSPLPFPLRSPWRPPCSPGGQVGPAGSPSCRIQHRHPSQSDPRTHPPDPRLLGVESVNVVTWPGGRRLVGPGASLGHLVVSLQWLVQSVVHVVQGMAEILCSGSFQ